MMNGQQNNYLSDPDEIYRRSFAIVRDQINRERLDDDIIDVAERLVHATATPSLVDNLTWSPGATEIGRTALARSGIILVDGKMVVSGITRSRLPDKVKVMCTLDLGTVPGIAYRLRTTRAAAAVTLWKPWLEDSVVAIGNAPTALFRLLEGLASGWPTPALIIGFPVGVVGASEAKKALAENNHGIPFITLRGQLGGSAMAAAAINALGKQPSVIEK